MKKSKEILNLSAFIKATHQLQQSLICYHSDLVQQNPELIQHMRSATIQAFEFTYELAWKMLKRYLMQTEPNPNEIESMSFADLIRTGCERGLIHSELSIWKGFRQDRSMTSHTYDDVKAQEVFDHTPHFLQEAQHLLSALQQRINQ
jgi:nucleotidyltransferase substrate binding protein (TIGR01987 family)